MPRDKRLAMGTAEARFPHVLIGQNQSVLIASSKGL